MKIIRSFCQIMAALVVLAVLCGVASADSETKQSEEWTYQVLDDGNAEIARYIGNDAALNSSSFGTSNVMKPLGEIYYQGSARSQPFWGQNNYRRYEVKSIVFSDSAIPTADAWDISETGNRNILAWMDDGTLYVYSPHKIYLPKDSSRLFCGFCSLESIYFGDLLDTSNVTNMLSMFASCEKLSTLDLSTFDTSNVTNMNSMFDCCEKLSALGLSSFDTTNVTDMALMFDGCENLEAFDLSSLGRSNIRG